MKSGAKSYEIDMCQGPLLGKILLFSVPLMLSGILQLLFNAADIVVVGRFAGSQSLAAVGSTSSLINLLTNVFIGLSVGTNVLIARYYGGRQEKEVRETVHTAVLLSLISGLLLCVLGLVAAAPLLELMGTPEDVLAKAVMYIRIYFLGMPVMLLFNFGSAILRAVGDTKRPLYYLMGAGVINVILNLIFVIALRMDVAGVALATIVSQCISAVCIVRCLMQTDSSYRLVLKELRIYKDKLIWIVRIGLPAGVQGAIFAVSNVLIQSSVNSFGSIAMAGNTAASNIEGFTYTSMNAMHQTAVSFTGQNYGARQFGRINKVMIQCLLIVTVIGVGMSTITLLFAHELLGMYSSDAQVVAYGIRRMSIFCTTYFLCGIMDTLVGGIRGLGYSVTPMIVSLLGACGLRILWIFMIFKWSRSLEILYLSYPVTWSITIAAHAVCYFFIRRKLKKFERKV